MTDTSILDGMMQMLKRNPLSPPGSSEKVGVRRPAVTTDERPFYARREVVSLEEANPNFAEAADVFHQNLTTPRTERPRQGSCPRVMREFDGVRWHETQVCGGIVHAVETVVAGAVRVDGKCLSCGAEVHRAGIRRKG